MLGLFLAPFAELYEFYFLGYKLFILAGPVIYALAVAAGKLYKSILGHRLDINIKARQKQPK
jgi:hypothetical protein